MPAQPNIESLASIATGRTTSLFAADVTATKSMMRETVTDKRILVIGGAGTIGGATVEFIADLLPASLHVIDQNENGLAELTRHLRSRQAGLAVPDFRTFPIDFGSSILHAVLDVGMPYDIVLNFAALKHVRSEKDVPSLLQMLDTNLVKNRHLIDALSRRGFAGRYFCVSTDKAANPVSLMGASKRIMEHLIFSRRCNLDFAGHVTSARFANVAFSDGSLLHGFRLRLEKGQPLSAPRDTRRYFVSPRESGEICAIAALTGPRDVIVVPRLNPEEHLRKLDDIGIGFLALHGLTARLVNDEIAARDAMQAVDNSYPLLLSLLDTSGEKPFEEFVGRDEIGFDLGLTSLRGVNYLPPPPGSLEQLMELLDQALSGTARPDKDDLIHAMALVVPEFQHRDTGRNLDQRM